MAQMLIKLVSLDVVQATLELLNGTSAPGIDGVRVSIYKTFPKFPQAQCARSATIWAPGRTRDPYFEILGAPRGIMVTRSGGFEF